MTTTTTTPADPVQKLVDLTREKRELEDRLQQVVQELTARESQVLDLFAHNGYTRISTKDGATAYLSRSLYARLNRDENDSHESAHQALTEHDLEYLVKPTVNLNSLKAWVRQMERDGTPIPEGLQPWIKTSEIFKVKVKL